MSQPEPTVEMDPRFPSGPWMGYFLQRPRPGRSRMEMQLTFHNGALSGEGRDWVGPFVMRGRYFVEDGTCHWTKRYLGKHDVFYKGYNEGKGIWGVWEISMEDAQDRGGFHIWPKGMAGAESDQIEEQADLPAIIETSAASPQAKPVMVR